MTTVPCSLCDRASSDPLQWADSARVCAACAQQLGQLIEQLPGQLGAVWPTLLEREDASPEPRVRLPDGRSVELRERTAELKKELSLEQRSKLVGLLGELGLEREQLLEAAYVLRAADSREHLQRALDGLAALAAPDAVSRLRRHLLPS